MRESSTDIVKRRKFQSKLQDPPTCVVSWDAAGRSGSFPHLDHRNTPPGAGNGCFPAFSHFISRNFTVLSTSCANLKEIGIDNDNS